MQNACIGDMVQLDISGTPARSRMSLLIVSYVASLKFNVKSGGIPLVSRPFSGVVVLSSIRRFGGGRGGSGPYP